MKNHTPYKIIEHSWSDCSVVDANNETVFTTSKYSEATEENQDELEQEMLDKLNFIVKACNTHDRLVEALEEAYAALGKCTIVDGSTIDAHLKAKQLLTELKIIK